MARIAGVNLPVNKRALVSYLSYNFVAGKETIFNGIKTILPGNYLTLNLNDYCIEEHKWWKPEEKINYYQNLIPGKNTEKIVSDLVHDLVYDSIWFMI